jgi:CHAT domain-containing protein
VTRYSQITGEELTQKIEAYLRLVQSKGEADQTQAKQLSTELYALLVAPVVDQLDSAREICIIPNRILCYLPFASLVSPTDGRFLVEKFATFYSPSANVFLRCTRNGDLKSDSGPENILAVGNPSYDRVRFGQLLDLPESAKEASQIASEYSESTPLLNASATSTAFRSTYKNFSVIHFAGHYITEPNAPLASKLVMAKSGDDDGVITNGELINASLPKTKLVVLSACQTAIEGYYGGEGLVGLSRTFIAAGVPIVVASSWPVDSASTAKLMQQFHSYRRHDLTTVRALRQAQIDMIAAADPIHSQPYAWAGFSAFGGYTTF